MKTKLYYLLAALVAYLAPATGLAQTAPGWGWAQKFGDSVYGGASNVVAGLGRDAAGNLYMAGTYVGRPTFNGQTVPSAGNFSEGFLAKFDPAGNPVWLKGIRGLGYESVTSLVVAPDGQCILGGALGAGPGQGASFGDFASSVTLPGALALGLPNQGSATNPYYGGVPFLASVTANGALSWANCPSPGYGFTFKGLALDAQGGIHASVDATGGMTVGGLAYPPIGTTDAVLLKYDATGQLQWVHRAGAASYSTPATAVITDQSGAVYWSFNQNSPVTFDQTPVARGGSNTLVKLTAANRVSWLKNAFVTVNGVSGNTKVAGIDATTGTFYLTALSPSGGTVSASNGTASITVPTVAKSQINCVVRCDSTGQVQQISPVVTNTYLSTGNPRFFDNPSQVLPHGTGFMLVSTTSPYGQTAFAGSATVLPYSEATWLYVLRYNPASGQTQWVRGTTGSGTSTYSGIRPVQSVADAAGNVYVAGTYGDTSAQFGAIALNGPQGPADWFFLAKLDQTVLPTKTAAASQLWSIYPNPATGVAHLTGLPAQAQVRVLDPLGRVVRTTTTTTLSLTGLAAGLYVVQVTGTSTPHASQRLVVE